ncbi:MAG TPA: MarR family transcriptional regulator [Opitutaceae bacterium]|nr:MarR family transcriptional regulator [Opitutaceae bacterium]
MPKALAPREYHALASFRHALRTFTRFSAAAARRAGISPQQHQALLAIKGFGGARPITVGTLAEKLALQPHSAVGLLDRLVKRGLARRQTDPDDRRRVDVSLTGEGEALIGRLSAAHREELRRLAPELRLLLRALR